ncbi:choice-of-anchor C family protein [Kitasatospora sp. NPDC088548]|uniref:choice-of-anchor C family protein n=1 Tax=Kitasatospora sp. NPDC088548 TaxID=3364075 RepID=UPI00382E3FD8
MLTSRACAAAVTAVLLAAGTAATALPAHAAGPSGRLAALSRFDDGSFETPKVAANTFQELVAGQTIGPWQVTSGSVDLIGAGFWQAAEGDQSVDLNGSAPGSVSQAFTTVPGAAYTVTYSLAGNPEAAPAVKTGQALVDGQDFQDFTFNTAGRNRAAMGYVTRQFTFVATSAATTLAFASTTPNSAAGPVVDNVQVQRCAPCPSCN